MDGLQPGPLPAPAADARAPAMTDADWLAGDDQAASPEEQDLYEQFVARAYLLIYEDEKVFADLVAMLKAGDPVTQLATAAAMVVYRVKAAADEAGKELPGDVVLHAGKEVFEDLAELAWKIGAHDFKTDTKALEAAWLKAMDQFRLMSEQSGTLDKEAANQDWASLKQADQSGALKQATAGLLQKGRQPPPAVNENVKQGVKQAPANDDEDTGLKPRAKGTRK